MFPFLHICSVQYIFSHTHILKDSSVVDPDVGDPGGEEGLSAVAGQSVGTAK